MERYYERLDYALGKFLRICGEIGEKRGGDLKVQRIVGEKLFYKVNKSWFWNTTMLRSMSVEDFDILITKLTIRTPIYFKSKKPIDGFDADTTFLVKEIPSYGLLKIYYYDGLLELFVFFYKKDFIKHLEDGAYYEVENINYKPR